ncbi:MAG: hypothetical protein RIQ53_4613 [Pseudomonadota bacterium]
MRRADRLFQLVQLIRGRRLSTAAWLAERLQVSLRTVYRDVAALQARGVAIEGEAGVGYRVGAGQALPPLMFPRGEAQALVAAVRLAGPRLDPALAAQAEAALARIMAVLPGEVRTAAERLLVYSPDAGQDAQALDRLQALREAADQRRWVAFDYRDESGRASRRRVRPLACLHWGQVWTLAAWCALREDFRSFRLDRIDALQVEDARFRDEPGRTLADLQRRVAAESGGRLA